MSNRSAGKEHMILTVNWCLRLTPSSVCHTSGHYLIAWELVAPCDRSHWFQATKSVAERELHRHYTMIWMHLH